MIINYNDNYVMLNDTEGKTYAADRYFIEEKMFRILGR